MNDDYLKKVMKEWCAEKGWIIKDDIYISHKLMFHYALLINPSLSGYEERYCYKNLTLLTKAVNEYIATGKLRYWHKNHSKGISVKGNNLYTQGMLQEPKYSIGNVDWIVE